MKIILLLFFYSVSAKTDVDENNSATVKPRAFGENNVLYNITDIPKDGLPKSAVNKTKVQNENRVYLEDVFYGLNNIKWEGEQELCLNHTLLLLKSLQNYTLWAVWMWDSISPEPYGLFYGLKHHLGNFDQCLYPPWPPEQSGFHTQYCLAEVKLGRKGDFKGPRNSTDLVDPHQSALDYLHHTPKYYRSLHELTWGVCVPSSCSRKSVQSLLRVLLSRSHLGVAGVGVDVAVDETCQTVEPEPVDAASSAFGYFVCVFVAMTLFCSFIATRQAFSNKETFWTAIAKAFSAKNNAAKLTKISKQDDLAVVYGLRFLSICVVVIGHQVGLLQGGPVSNGRNIDKDYFTYPGIFMARMDLAVDTFFWMSGLLSVWTLMSLEKIPNPLILIFKRYVRLAVAYGVMVFFMSGAFYMIGSGPLWARGAAYEIGLCRENWWLNMLMVSNYINSEKMCYLISWYVPCDFHCSVIAILLWYIWRKNKTLGLSIGAVIGVASIIGHGVINYFNELTAVQVYMQDFNENPRNDIQFHITYIKTHTRFGAYFVGMASAYFLKKWSRKEKQICKGFAVTLAWFALAWMAAIVVLGWALLTYTHSPLMNAVYAALNRPLWALGLSTLLFCSAYGSVPLVAPFLRWRAWVSLSRLVYGVYLVHGVIIMRNVCSARNPTHQDYLQILILSAGDVVWSYGLALVMWLVIEAPANNIVSLCLGYRTKSTPRKSEENLEESNQEIDSTSGGNYQNNLVENAQFSSKV